MPCYHPRKGFVVGTNPSGLPKYKIVPFETDHIDMVDGKPEPSMIPLQSQRAEYAIRDWIMIPCGKCLGCRLNYAKQWSARLQCEYQMHDSDTCWFLTLTYNDEAFADLGDPNDPNKPDRLRIGADPGTGEIQFYLNLDPRDMTLFIKRLRQACVRKYGPGCKLKYFYSGEYGSSTGRPHFHMIVYGLPLEPSMLVEYARNDVGDMTYKCQWLDDLWRLGFVVVGRVSLESCAYVARYCLKKIYDGGDDFSNRTREFVRMSRNPGLGKGWLDVHPEVFEVSQFSLPSKKGSQTFMHPRYFMEYLRKYDPTKYTMLRDCRRLAGELSYNNAITCDDRPYLVQLAAKESDLRQRIFTKLKRSLK